MAAKQSIDPDALYRVKNKNTRHESTMTGSQIHAFGADDHEILDKPAADDNGNPLPAKPHLTPSQAKAAQAAETEEQA